MTTKDTSEHAPPEDEAEAALPTERGHGEKAASVAASPAANRAIRLEAGNRA